MFQQKMSSYHQFKKKSYHNFSGPDYMFKGEIKGRQHSDKNWLDNARTCMVDVLRRDTNDMRRFGGDTVYIQTLKDILNKYDPSVPYSSLKHCNGVNEQKQLCANRRAHETDSYLVCRLLLEKKNTTQSSTICITLCATKYSGLLSKQYVSSTLIALQLD